MKIRTTKVYNYVRTTCGLSDTEKARKLKPPKFLLEVILAKERKFAQVKISRYTVIFMLCENMWQWRMCSSRKHVYILVRPLDYATWYIAILHLDISVVCARSELRFALSRTLLHLAQSEMERDDTVRSGIYGLTPLRMLMCTF